MSKKGEPDQPRSEATRRPPVRTYAAQAQRYLDEGDVDEALRICRNGFEANPEYEEGALTYLRALAQAKDLDTGAQVFTVAAERRPRSATLRVAWARVLLDARRAEEARDLAHEAIALDPNHGEALELLSSLGETPAGHQRSAIPAPRAALRAWVRPVGQRTSATSLFDLSTPPPSIDPSKASSGRYMFDTQPMPLSDDTEGDEGSSSGSGDQLSSTGERDLFPALESLDASEELPSKPEAPRAGAASEPEEHPRQATRRRKPAWIVGTAVLLAGVVGTSIIAFVIYRERKLEQSIAAAIAQADPDTKEAFIGALRALERIAADQGDDDPRINGAMALLRAHLWKRFGHGDRASVVSYAAKGEDQPTALLARAMLDPAARRKKISSISPEAGGWHLRLLQLMEMTARGDYAASARLVDAELGLAAPSPAVLAAGAASLRRRGETKRAGRLLETALKRSPGHVEATLEDALLQLERGSPSAADLRRLRGLAGDVPRHKGRVTLLIASAARAAGKIEDALALLTRAAKLAPEDPDVHWYAALWRLGPNGDAAKALALLDEQKALLARTRPDAPLVRARALLLLGRPHEARAALDSARVPANAVERQAWQQELAVRSAHAIDDQRDLDRRCKKPRQLRVRIACIETLLERSQIPGATELAADAAPPPVQTYLSGLFALAEGNAPTAIGQLRKAIAELAASPREGSVVDAAEPFLALGRAHALRSQLTAALAARRRALLLDASSMRARVALAEVLVALGHDTEARMHLEHVLAGKPTAPLLLSAAGEALLTLGLVEMARTLVEVRADAKAATAVRLLAGRVALADGKLSRAREIFQSVLEDHPQSTEAMIALGRIESVQGRRSQAQRLFAKALQLRPKEPQLLFLFAQTEAQLGRYRDALPVGLDAIKQFRETGQTWRALDALVTLGRLFRRGNSWAVHRAEELLFEACKHRAAPAIAFLELGRTHRALGDTKRHIWCLRQAVARDPNLAVAYRDLGLALRGQRRTRKQAQRALRAYLRLAPNADDAPKIKALLRKR